jgi:hypothetical protein
MLIVAYIMLAFVALITIISCGILAFNKHIDRPEL